MATMTVLGQDQKIHDRVDQLEEMRLIVTGQISDLRAQLADREAHLARIEGGIIELNALTIPKPEAKEEPAEEKET